MWLLTFIWVGSVFSAAFLLDERSSARSSETDAKLEELTRRVEAMELEHAQAQAAFRSWLDGQGDASRERSRRD
jgi:hypothetical protein